MCASASHGTTAVIDDATKLNTINGEPPRTIVQTNLTHQRVSKTKPVRIRSKNSAPQLSTNPTTMGNQQGSEGGKNRQGSKKREKSDNSKSNSPNGEGSLRKSKSPSIKSSTSPASPSKKLFRRKQQSVKKETTTEEEPKVQGACASDQQPVQEVFTDARESVEASGQNNQDKCGKVACDSSSDNVSFESVSCATPLRVATPCSQRAKPPGEVSPVDRVDELGKSIERTIMERFSDNSNLLDVRVDSTKPVSNKATPTNPTKSIIPETHGNEQKEQSIKPDFQDESTDKTTQAYCALETSEDISKPDQQPSVMENPQKTAKPVRKIKIEHEGVESSSKSKIVDDTHTKQSDDTGQDSKIVSVGRDTADTVKLSSSEKVSEFTKAAEHDCDLALSGENVSESFEAVENISESVAAAGKASVSVLAAEMVSESIVSAKMVCESALATEPVKEPAKATEKVSEPIVATSPVGEATISTEKASQSIEATGPVNESVIAKEKVSESVVAEEKLSESIVATGRVSDSVMAARNAREPAAAGETVRESTVATGPVSESVREAEKISKSVVAEEKLSESIVATGRVCDSVIAAENASESAAAAETVRESTVAAGPVSESVREAEKFSKSVVAAEADKSTIVDSDTCGVTTSQVTDLQKPPLQLKDGKRSIVSNEPSVLVELGTTDKDNIEPMRTDGYSREENKTQTIPIESCAQALEHIDSVSQSVEKSQRGSPDNIPQKKISIACAESMYKLCETSNSTEGGSTNVESAGKESSEGSPSVSTPTEAHPTLTRLFISESDIIKSSEKNGEGVVKESTECANKKEHIETIKAESSSESMAPNVVKRGALLSQQSASVDRTFLEPANRQATLAEKRQHRLTDPLVDTLLLLIKQTMESDNMDEQGEITQASKPSESASDVKLPTDATVEVDNKGPMTETEDLDKTLTPEDMAEFERLKKEASAAEDMTIIGGTDDDTLTQEDLAEFDRLKKQMSKAAADTDIQTENDDDNTLHGADRFDLSSGETTEDSVIERPIKKVPVLTATQEEEIPVKHAEINRSPPVESSVADSHENRDLPKPESPVIKKRSMTEEEIRREIRKFMIPEMKEALPNGGSMKQMLNDLHDITPTSEFYPPMEDRDSTNSPEQDNRSGLRSRTSITSSELDISEQRDDMSTDSMYADDEDDSSSEVLFCKTYTEPVRGTEVLVSCTVVNSALKEANSSSDEFWAENSASEDAYQQVEFAAAAVNRHFTHARSQMQDIQHHLQALKHQMQDMETQVVKTRLAPADEFAFDDPERRAITD